MSIAGREVSWEVLTIIASVAVAISVGAIWLGSATQQIEINTKRLEKIESYMDEMRRSDATQLAGNKDLERRVMRLEGMESRPAR